MMKEIKEPETVKRFQVDAKNPKSIKTLAEMTGLELVRLIGARVMALGLGKYNEIGDKAFLDLGVQQVKPSKPEPADPNGVKYPSGLVLPRSPRNNDHKYRTTGAYAGVPPLVTGDPESKLSEHFKLKEFRCHDRANYPDTRVSPRLIAALEKIRNKVGRTVHVLSAYRPKDYNDAIPGAASNSQHIDGLAADIYCDDINTKTLYDICDQVIGSSGGVGYYPHDGFVHVDTRGYEARW